MNKMDQVTFDFPEDIITEILSKLPIKLLIQFTIVCKTWLSIIKSPEFMSKHLALNNSPNYSKSLLVLSRNNYERKYSMSLRTEDSPEIATNLEFPFLGDGDFLQIAGVSYGLVCVRLSRLECDLVVCNPSTRKFVNVPKKTKWNPDNWSIFRRGDVGDVAVGFAFDPCVNDYKVVKLLRSYGARDNLVEEQAWIYAMSSGRWREIKIRKPIGNDLRLELSSPAAQIGSVCHWSCHYLQSYNNRVILTFDMSDETFGLISAPQDFRTLSGNNYTVFHLGQVNGELAFLGINSLGILNVWTLNADSRGWSLKFSVELVPVIGTIVEVEEGEPVAEEFRLVGSRRDSDVLFEAPSYGKDSVFLYDLVSKEIKRLPLGEDHYYFRVDGYTESLFPVIKNGEASQRSRTN